MASNSKDSGSLTLTRPEGSRTDSCAGNESERMINSKIQYHGHSNNNNNSKIHGNWDDTHPINLLTSCNDAKSEASSNQSNDGWMSHLDQTSDGLMSDLIKTKDSFVSGLNQTSGSLGQTPERKLSENIVAFTRGKFSPKSEPASYIRHSVRNVTPRPKCCRNLFGPDESVDVDDDGNEIPYRIAKRLSTRSAEDVEEEMELNRAEMIPSEESLLCVPLMCRSFLAQEASGTLSDDDSYTDSAEDGDEDYSNFDEGDTDMYSSFTRQGSKDADSCGEDFDDAYNNDDIYYEDLKNALDEGYHSTVSNRRFRARYSSSSSCLHLRPRILFFDTDALLDLENVSLGGGEEEEEEDSEAEYDHPRLRPEHYVAPKRQRRLAFRFLHTRDVTLPVRRRLCFENPTSLSYLERLHVTCVTGISQN